MKHISELFEVFKGYISRDQVIKDRVKQYLKDKLQIDIEDKQIKVGKTIVMLTHLHFAQREQLQNKFDFGIIDFVNKNEHNFSIQDVIIK